MFLLLTLIFCSRSLSVSHTCLMLSGVVGDFHGVHLQALRAFTNVVDPGDVGTLFVYHLHHLEEKERDVIVL